MNKGDKVFVLDEVINGIVVFVKNNEVLIEFEEGFLMIFFVNELIKV